MVDHVGLVYQWASHLRYSWTGSLITWPVGSTNWAMPPCFRTFGLPVQLDIWNSSSYRLSHATITLLLTRPVCSTDWAMPLAFFCWWMPAAKGFCQKSRGYVKIGTGSQYGPAKISFELYGDRQIAICGDLDKSNFIEKNVDGDRLWEEWLPSVVGIFRLLKTSIGTH